MIILAILFFSRNHPALAACGCFARIGVAERAAARSATPILFIGGGEAWPAKEKALANPRG
jgi:hypothetical protein